MYFVWPHKLFQLLLSLVLNLFCSLGKKTGVVTSFGFMVGSFSPMFFFFFLRLYYRMNDMFSELDFIEWQTSSLGISECIY